ncbi:TetR/AcrR family transcriptional regulator [Sporosarcina sp. G11-34]|uniref:TetR/AcrR family transcriptional regulator n=1 Tax=Sporosarcina sp. G11-34 TaxID=2849605 RepID=UPI0022A994EF|nr:TetR/AcrR family transcriptional regulator [Sporosarcina sp. G11-34]MCZ2257426.1 TetR/AcrR family transcriptional regulator [Sporosarcina sp. G11-34]
MKDRKQQVLLTAQRLFAENGFPGTSIQDILDESSISKGTFYNYFSSKNACLIEILERAVDESTVRRLELLIGQSTSDKSILAKQISVRMQVNREYNLLPIFEAVFHSGDRDLRDFIVKQHLKELAWLTERFVDIYGKNAAPYASDCAVLMFGMMQHILHVRKTGSKKEVNTLELVHFVLRRIDSIIAEMIETKDFLIGDTVFFNQDKDVKEYENLKKQLPIKLDNFLKELDENSKSKSEQYILFLIDELQSTDPRIFLLETVVRSFRETFSGTPYERLVREIASDVWRFVGLLESE